MENKKIFVLGMARSGYEVAKLLAKKNNSVLITDMAEQNEDHVKELEELGVKVVITKEPEELLDKTFDMVVKNPGIIQSHDVIIKAIELKIPVVNEMEVAYGYLPKDIFIVGISGSNGKTTTTTIIYDIMKMAKKPVHIAGNIGFPLSSFIGLVKENDILIIEISSHQLVNFKEFKTDISVFTNLSETHLDFFQTYDNYVANKKRLFQHHTKENLAIINLNNNDSLQITSDIDSNKKYFSVDKEADSYIENNIIYYENKEVIKLNEIKVKGNHNYENIMCAIMVVKQFDIENSIIKKVLKNFAGVEHRIEHIRNINGRTFYNDSKSTNVNSTQIALRAFDSPTILILGGLDRGLAFDELKQDIKNVKLIVCYGETRYIIEEFSENQNIPCIVTETLKEATTQSYNHSEKKDTILFSPACASWDQYINFEVRGNEFKCLVNKLK